MKNATYIKFANPKTGKESSVDGIAKRTLKKAINGILSAIIPIANPDFENKFDSVKIWLVELNSHTRIAERENGLDENGQVIVKMPFKNNYGYWTDNNLLLEDFKVHFKTSEINNADFEKYWNSIDLITDVNL